MAKYSDRRKNKKSEDIDITRKKVKNPKSVVSDVEEDLLLKELSEKTISYNEREYVQEYLFLYTKLKALIRKSESKALETGSSREYYALCTLISQQREIIADIRSIADLSSQVQMLIDLALQPMMSEIGQVVVNSFYQYRKLITETTSDKETQFALKKLDEITSDISRALQQQYELAATKINDILVGVPEKQPKKKGRK